jgi:transcription-repair coupling factor (superfamily II helicase)
MRAAFKAVADGMQVAVLVPTTVLAQQHFDTFAERMAAFPIRVDMVSRFRTRAQQNKTLAQTLEGEVDILIGTHRLLSNDVNFKNLGLVVIDEEQRFGVAHKERLKRLRRTVDVLALTATPIPRTLHMSLLGIRDLSVIATPPEYRYPIKTYVCVRDDMIIAEAIHRELERGGQAFFVHNNIGTIQAMAQRIETLVPTARVGVAHGRMSDDELEQVMLAFLYHEVDVLVCTSIIESGLDFPSANTIVINRADRFGLSQIYQLRGRVGRGNDQAYAYLFIPHENAITRDAQKRLRVLMEHSDLGSGFQIAMKDLQIRGGGTILGPTQSGQVAAVGYEMYLQLMERAIGELKGEPVKPEVDPEVIVPFSAYIPDHYIQDIDQRVTFYRRLAKVTEEPELQSIGKELADRFGPIPDPVGALLEKIHLKLLCKRLAVTRLELSRNSMTVAFSETTPVGPEKLMGLIQESPKRFHMKTDYMLRVNLTEEETGTDVKAAKKVLQELGS